MSQPRIELGLNELRSCVLTIRPLRLIQIPSIQICEDVLFFYLHKIFIDHENHLESSHLFFFIYAYWLIKSLGKIPMKRNNCYWRPNSAECQVSHWDERYLLWFTSWDIQLKFISCTCGTNEHKKIGTLIISISRVFG
jgi:hypothetical protein